MHLTKYKTLFPIVNHTYFTEIVVIIRKQITHHIKYS